MTATFFPEIDTFEGYQPAGFVPFYLIRLDGRTVAARLLPDEGDKPVLEIHHGVLTPDGFEPSEVSNDGGPLHLQRMVYQPAAFTGIGEPVQLPTRFDPVPGQG